MARSTPEVIAHMAIPFFEDGDLLAYEELIDLEMVIDTTHIGHKLIENKESLSPYNKKAEYLIITKQLPEDQAWDEMTEKELEGFANSLYQVDIQFIYNGVFSPTQAKKMSDYALDNDLVGYDGIVEFDPEILEMQAEWELRNPELFPLSFLLEGRFDVDELGSAIRIGSYPQYQ